MASLRLVRFGSEAALETSAISSRKRPVGDRLLSARSGLIQLKRARMRSMAITSVRFYFLPNSARREKNLSFKLWGFCEWFEYRLKVIREELRGPEVKGVNTINFCLYEKRDRMFKHDVWWQRANSFEYDTLYDLAALSEMHRVKAIQQLMAWAAPIALAAPWPQAVAVGRALSVPLSEHEIAEILPYLQWPRGDIKRNKSYH